MRQSRASSLAMCCYVEVSPLFCLVVMVLATENVDRVRACRCPRCGSSDAGSRTLYSSCMSSRYPARGFGEEKGCRQPYRRLQQCRRGRQRSWCARHLQRYANQQTQSSTGKLFNTKQIDKITASYPGGSVGYHRTCNNRFNVLVGTRPLKQCISTAKLRWSFVLKAVS